MLCLSVNRIFIDSLSLVIAILERERERQSERASLQTIAFAWQTCSNTSARLAGANDFSYAQVLTPTASPFTLITPVSLELPPRLETETVQAQAWLGGSATN